MPFTPINVVNGSTPANATWGNLVQTQYTEATSSLGQDLTAASPFVLSGLACVKDPATANKLNVGAGVAYLLQTDNTLRRRANSLTSVTTSALSSTYFLDLNPDGTFSFATTHSGVANYLPLCSVTTDGSGNIASVTDARVFTLKLLTGGVNSSVKTPPLQLPAPISAILTQSALNYGTVVGGVTFGQTGALAASMDGAARFNGTTDAIAAQGSSGLPTGNGAFSMEAWFKTSTATGTLGILQFGNPGISKQGGALYLNAGKLTGDLGGSAVASAVTYSNGAWHHGVFTWDGTNGTLYVDGAQVATSATLGPNNSTLGLAVGLGALIGSSGTGNSFFNGTLDEAAIYGTALSLARVQAHYNAGTATASDAYATTVLADSPLRYYRLGDASGSSVAVCTTSPTATTLVDAGGTLKSIGGQATAGSLGVPVVVAVGSAVTITDKVDHTILSFTPTVTGFYRASIDMVPGAETGFAATFTVVYKSGIDGSTGTQPVTVGNGYPTLISVYAQAGNAIAVHYQNSSTGTPINDKVIAILERLS